MKISLILLAAGDSRRFGSNKLLYELHGKPMYRYSVDEVAKLDTTVFAEKIVVSQYDEILDTLSREGYLTVRNTESYLGISHSIQLGLAASEEEAWCFLVADQPYLKAETLERFVEAFQKSGKSCACVRLGTELEIRVFLRQNIKKSYWNLPEILGGSAS